MTLTTTAATIACPHCTARIAASGRDIHYCVQRLMTGRKTIVHREYVGYLDGSFVAARESRAAVEVELDRLVIEQAAEGLLASATALYGDSADDPFNDGPSQEEQAAAAARWTECEGGWEQYLPHPFDPSKPPVRLFQPRLFVHARPADPTPEFHACPCGQIEGASYATERAAASAPAPLTPGEQAIVIAGGRYYRREVTVLVTSQQSAWVMFVAETYPRYHQFFLTELERCTPDTPQPPVDDGPDDNWGGFRAHGTVWTDQDGPADEDDTPAALLCAACKTAKAPTAFTQIRPSDLLPICDLCRDAAIARITAAVLEEIKRPGPRCLSCTRPTDRPNTLCEACQEAGRPWPLPMLVGSLS